MSVADQNILVANVVIHEGKVYSTVASSNYTPLFALFTDSHADIHGD